MTNDIRYDLIFGVSFFPYQYDLNVDMRLRLNEKPWNYNLDSAICLDRARLLQSPDRLTKPSTSLVCFEYAQLWDEEVVCKGCGETREARPFEYREEKYGIFDSLVGGGTEATFGFVPTFDLCENKDALFMPESFYREIQKHGFDAGLNVFDAHFPSSDQSGRVHWVENDASALKSQPLFVCFPGSYSGRSNERFIGKELVGVCSQCGCDQCYCVQCFSPKSSCPKCGIQLKPGVNMKIRITKNEESLLFTNREKVPCVVPRIEDACWRVEDVLPLNGALWAGNDLFNIPFNYPLPDFNFECTGRFAKWLVDNQYGPLTLTPYPVDASHCSQEQLAKLDSIAFVCPKAQKPGVLTTD